MNSVWPLSERNIKMAILWRGENSCVAVNSDGGIPHHTATAVQDLTSHTLNKQQPAEACDWFNKAYISNDYLQCYFLPHFELAPISIHIIFIKVTENVSLLWTKWACRYCISVGCYLCLRVIGWIHAMHDLDTYIVDFRFFKSFEVWCHIEQNILTHPSQIITYIVLLFVCFTWIFLLL